MSEMSASHYLRRRIEATIAFLLMIVLVAAGVLLGAEGGSRTPQIHYLGMRGMELAAFSGKLALTMTVTSPPTGSSTTPTSTTMPIRNVQFSLTAPSSSGTGANTGPATLSAINIMRVADKNTPKLDKAVATGTTYQSVLVTASRVSSGKVVEKLQMLFKPADVQSDRFSVSASSVMEQIVLASEAFTLKYSRP